MAPKKLLLSLLLSMAFLGFVSTQENTMANGTTTPATETTTNNCPVCGFREDPNNQAMYYDCSSGSGGEIHGSCVSDGEQLFDPQACECFTCWDCFHYVSSFEEDCSRYYECNSTHFLNEHCLNGDWCLNPDTCRCEMDYIPSCLTCNKYADKNDTQCFYDCAFDYKECCGSGYDFSELECDCVPPPTTTKLPPTTTTLPPTTTTLLPTTTTRPTTTTTTQTTVTTERQTTTTTASTTTATPTVPTTTTTVMTTTTNPDCLGCAHVLYTNTSDPCDYVDCGVPVQGEPFTCGLNQCFVQESCSCQNLSNCTETCDKVADPNNANCYLTCPLNGISACCAEDEYFEQTTCSCLVSGVTVAPSCPDCGYYENTLTPIQTDYYDCTVSYPGELRNCTNGYYWHQTDKNGDEECYCKITPPPLVL